MTEKPRRPSAEIRAEIAAAEAKHDEIGQRIEAARAEIVRLQEESTKLLYNGYKYSSGVIPDLQRELRVEMKLEEFDAGIPVVWVDGKRPGFGGNQNYIVTKVTPKRIFVRDDQYFCDDQYEITGSKPGGSRFSSHQERIDIQATFGVPEITAKLWAEMKDRKANGQ